MKTLLQISLLLVLSAALAVNYYMWEVELHVLPGSESLFEREAFISLCGEPKSQERMQHMLTTNKPLRN